eukprot:11162706-Lingulodinium_polyedra.AAC.1
MGMRIIIGTFAYRDWNAYPEVCHESEGPSHAKGYDITRRPCHSKAFELQAYHPNLCSEKAC